MAKFSLPKGKAQIAFVGVIASVVALTFGVAGKRIYTAATDTIGSGISANSSASPVGGTQGEGAGQAPANFALRVDPSLGSGSSAASPASGAGAGGNAPGAPLLVPGQFAVKRVLQIDGPMKHGSFVWDEEGVPKDGQVIVTVDLAAQTMSVFRGGYEIGAAVIVYGADNKETPLGMFPISQKKVDHTSNLYDAPMPYMQRLTNDGVAIHASEVDWGNATHGCIGIPLEFAKKLYGATKLGDVVIITDGKKMAGV